MLLFMEEIQKENLMQEYNDSINAPDTKYKLSETVKTMTASLRKIMTNIYFIDPLYENEELSNTVKHLEHLTEEAKVDELLPTWRSLRYKNPLSGLMNPLAPPLICPHNGETSFRVSFNKAHQGIANAAHGGVISSVFDDVILRTSQQTGKYCATAEVTTVYKRPTPINTELIINSKIVDVQENKIIIFAEMICNEIVTATATAIVIPVNPEKMKNSISKTLTD